MVGWVGGAMTGYLQKAQTNTKLFSRVQRLPMTSQSKDDEMALKTVLHKVGFTNQLRFRTLLTPPEAIKNNGSGTQPWDFFQDGRLAFLTEAGSNLFLANSELCFYQCLRKEINLLSASDMLHPSGADVWFNPAGRAAQRGKAWWEAVLRSLFLSPAKDDSPATHWVSGKDHIDIVDIHPHTGDAALASYSLMRDPTLSCSLRHIIAQLGYKNTAPSATFTQQRVLRSLEVDWCQSKFPLYDFEADSRGRCVQKPISAIAKVFTPEPFELQAIPGCYEAYLGLHKLELKVCRVDSQGHVKIAPEKLAEFIGADPAVKKATQALEDYHDKEIQNLLLDIMKDEKEGAADPRPEEEAQPLEEAPLMANGTFKSVEDLKASGVTIKAETKMYGMHTVRMLRDSTDRIWAVADQDSQALPKGTILGSFGAGKVREVPLESMIVGRHVGFDLPLGDRTPIILSKKASKEDDEEDIGSKLPDTLYKATKALMKANQGAAVKLAGMGTLQPVTEGVSKHGYEVEFPKGSEKYVNYTFELKAESGAEKKITAGNFFGPLANPQGLIRLLSLCWKCSFKPVHSKVNPVKPFVITNKTLQLVKGEPMLLGGPAEPAAQAPQ